MKFTSEGDLKSFLQSTEQIAIYGTGGMGTNLYQFLTRCNWLDKLKFFVLSQKNKLFYNGVQVKGVQELTEKDKTVPVIIATRENFHTEIINSLEKENIHAYHTMSEDVLNLIERLAIEQMRGLPSRRGEKNENTDKAVPLMSTREEVVVKNIDKEIIYNTNEEFSLNKEFEEDLRRGCGIRDELLHERLDFFKERVDEKYFVLDLECGHGKWLEYLQVKNIESAGVESDLKLVRECCSKGLDVTCSHPLNHLEHAMSSSADAVTMLHSIGVTPVSVLESIVKESFRILTENGIVMIGGICDTYNTARLAIVVACLKKVGYIEIEIHGRRILSDAFRDVKVDFSILERDLSWYEYTIVGYKNSKRCASYENTDL